MSPLRMVALGGALLLVVVLVVSLVSGLGGMGRGDADPAADPDGKVPRVRVEVLNAAGVPGLARAATERLRAAGYDVVFYGNARGFGPDTSLVLDRVGRPEWAQRVGDAAGIERVRTMVDSTLFVDVSVVLGRDWQEAAAGDTTRPRPDAR